MKPRFAIGALVILGAVAILTAQSHFGPRAAVANLARYRVDVTLSRAIGITYQNATQQTMTEHVTIYCNEVGSEVNALVSPEFFRSDAPATAGTLEIAGVGGSSYVIGTLVFDVRPGEFFGIQQYFTGAKIHSWVEEPSVSGVAGDAN